MLKIASVAATREIEQAADQSGYSYSEMMQAAGHSLAERILLHIGSRSSAQITFLAGKGNNGADGLIAAAIVSDRLPGAQICIYLTDDRADDPINACRTRNMLIAVSEHDSDRRVLKTMVANSDLVVDAIFGIGVRLPLPGKVKQILSTVKRIIQHSAKHAQQDAIHPLIPGNDRHQKPERIAVIAVDCPSGIDCDSGAADPDTIPADETVTFIHAKPGLLLFPAAEYTGNLVVADLRLPAALMTKSHTVANLLDSASVAALLPTRSVNSHKGIYGYVFIVAGSRQYIGAASLAAEAAYRAGSGVVAVATLQTIINSLAGTNREATWVALSEDQGALSEAAIDSIAAQLVRYKALLFGPGVGLASTTGSLLNRLLTHLNTTAPHIPLVIDADGLNLLAGLPDWHHKVPAGTILTPHVGEMARLANITGESIQENRWQIARDRATAWNTVLVLKGAHTVIAAPDGEIFISPIRTDALATAGTGDILAGMITSLLGQGMKPKEAALTGVYLHGLAGILAAARYNTRSIIASDILASLSDAFNLLEG
jgi:ADP-dependent NAD(P)H-hydrate dehydratase / NAD(P)H-hydrate epimerase